jgi:hypothetical protein
MQDLQFLSLSFTIMELMLFTCARSIHINTDGKELKNLFLHFRFSFEPSFPKLTSLFLAPPLRTTSCNVHYSGPIYYMTMKERLGASLWRTWPQLALWLVCNAAPWQKVTIFSNNCAIFCPLTVAFCGCDRSFEFTTVFRTYSAQFGTLSAVFPY